MAKYADPHREPAPVYKVGDPAMLSTRNLKVKRPSKKLDHKFVGPFQVERLISPTAVQLTLPQRWRSYPVFHVSELDPYRSRPPPDYAKILREVSDLEQEEEYDVEDIMHRPQEEGPVPCQMVGLPEQERLDI